MRVIVTRVQPQAARWAQRLSATCQAVALPLLETAALADTTALQQLGQHWADYFAVMFVSSHAVDFFYASNKPLAHIYKAQVAIKTRVWVTGPGSQAAVLAHGVPACQVDAPLAAGGQFDSEALWQQVHQQVVPGTRVLIVRGDSPGADEALQADPQNSAPTHANGSASASATPGAGRDWLAQRLLQAGATVDFGVAYQRQVPVWGDAERALATGAAADASVWLFSSAEAVHNLRRLLPSQNWAQARAIATHPRIAQAVRALGFAVVLETRPTLADTVASIESLA